MWGVGEGAGAGGWLMEWLVLGECVWCGDGGGVVCLCCCVFLFFF